MKVQLSIQGTTTIQMSVDEMLPLHGIMQRDLIAFTEQKYQINNVPATSSGVTPTPILVFQSGELKSMDNKIPIHHIIMFPDGYAIAAQDTDGSDAITADLMLRLQSEFGYRFANSKQVRRHLSHLAADFDRRFIEKAEALATIQKILTNNITDAPSEYQFKRFTFGCDTINDAAAGMTTPTSIEQVIRYDFTMERRVGEPFEKNRYYCIAPLPTRQHARLLEEIERFIVAEN